MGGVISRSVGVEHRDRQRKDGGLIVFRRLVYAIPVLSVAATVGLVGPPSASADCNYSGGSTLCSSTGSVRGGSAPPPATFDPYPCSNADPLCAYYDDWDPQIYIDLTPDRPNRPGGGPIIGGGGRPGRG